MKSFLTNGLSRNITIFDCESQIKDGNSLSQRNNKINKYIKNKKIYHDQILCKSNMKKLFQEKIFILLVLMLLMTSFAPGFICKKVESNLVNNDNYITLTIKGQGDQYIISPHYGAFPAPDTILLNGATAVLNNRTIHMTQDENIVVITWTQQFTSCLRLFEDLVNIVSIDFSHFDFSEVTNVYSMCQGCKSLEKVTFASGIIENKINTFESAFRSCESLTDVNINNMDTSNAISMSNMFNDCKSLVSLDLSHFNTTLVNATEYMFSGCKNIKVLDLSNFRTPNLIKMKWMFNGCLKLESLDISGFNTEKVDNMEYLFGECKELKSINISNFKTSSVNSMLSMFFGCNNLEYLDVSNFDTTLVTNMKDMFAYCNRIISLDFSHFYTPSLKNMYHMFYCCNDLSFLDVSHFNTSQVEDFSSLFWDCKTLTTLDLSSFDTSSVKNMNGMFFGCNKLENLDISNFKTENVENMGAMFRYCQSIKSLDLTHFRTPKLKTIEDMFNDCLSLEYLDVSTFNTEQVTSMQSVFCSCRKLKSLDINNFDTKLVTNMKNLFENCEALETLKIDNMNTESVTEMEHMFKNCKSLTSLDLTHFKTSRVTNMVRMFCDCKKLQYLDVSTFDTLKVNNMESLFRSTEQLIALNLLNFYILNDTNVKEILLFINPSVILCYNESRVSSNFTYEVNARNLENGCKKICILNSRKYILDIEKCVDNCHDETVYKNEYDNVCYNGCPPRTEIKQDSTYLCEDCRIFYNYEQTGCLDALPPKHYNNDTSAKTIDKCPDKCEECSYASIITYNNLCIKCNYGDSFYPKEDDPSNQGTYYECYKGEQIGYYLENLVPEGKIYKHCYSKCEKCDGPGDDNNNHCTACIDNDNVLEVVNGNCMCKNYYNYAKTGCISTIEDGYYNDNMDARTIDKCPDKCATCSYNSIIVKNNLCKSCKNGDGFYYKEDDDKNDIANSLFECYHKTQVLADYYLDETNNIFKRCYSKCETCSGSGDDSSNKCTKCYNDDVYELTSDGNCICRNYYNYGQTACIEAVPEGFYNNDISARTIDQCPTKCKNCTLDSIKDGKFLCTNCQVDSGYYPKYPENTNSYYECYQSEQVGYYLDTTEKIFKQCYSICSKCNGEGTATSNHCTECSDNVKYELKTDGNCICRNFYNFEKTDCINEIPEGFYNNDPTAKTIVQCPEKCKACSPESMSHNLCDICSNIRGYYPKENDPTNINPFYECYQAEQEGYYLDNEHNIFKPCHTLCKTCDGEGTDTSHHCTECNDNVLHELKDGNCICRNFYNFEKTGCINTINDGYYNDDVDARTIAKCPDKCGKCSHQSIIENNNLCVTCNIGDNYYPKYPENENENYECYQGEQEGYYLDNENNIFKPCYSKCKKCSGEGNDDNNNCLECIEDDNNYNLIDGNCNNGNDEFRVSYDVSSVSEGVKNDASHTFIDMNEDTVSHLREIFSLGTGSKIFVRIVESEESNLATADYTYEYILENGTKLDLDDIEEDVIFDVYVPLKDLDAVNFELAKEYSELGYDIYNLHSKFYTDFCTPVNLNGNDVPLAERKKEIYPNNITLCKDNCIYKGINLEERRVICQCNLNNNTSNENLVQEDESFAAYLVDYINWRLFLCYKLFFSAYYIRHSYAFFIILLIYIVLLICDYLFIYRTLESLKSFMIKQMPSYGKLYKEIFSESKNVDDNMINMNTIVNDGIIANPLKKEVEKNNNRKKTRKTKTTKKSIRSEKKEHFGLANEKYDEGININTDDQFKAESKKEKKKRKSKKNISEYSEKKQVIPENENENEDKKENLNELPYTKAIELDKRNVFYMYFSFLVEKLDFTSVCFISTRLRIMLFVELILSLLLNFFLNALLYSDDIVSHKYHNNGELDFAVSLALSIISNIVTAIICYYLKYTRGIDERIDLILEIKRDIHYFRNIKKFYVYLKRKFICFVISQIIVVAVCIYYIEIFCVKYHCSQISLVINYCYSFIESVITSLVITFAIIFTRKIGLSCSNKDFYNTSRFIDNKT